MRTAQLCRADSGGTLEGLPCLFDISSFINFIKKIMAVLEQIHGSRPEQTQSCNICSSVEEATSAPTRHRPSSAGQGHKALRRLESQGMGRLRGSTTIEDVRVKVPRNSREPWCGPELIGFLACMDMNGGDDRQCSSARVALSKCMGAAAAQRANVGSRHKLPINFHLKQVRLV